MQIDEYLFHYEQFFKEFGIYPTPVERKEKVVIEMCEFLEADFPGNEAAADDEAIDLMNTAITNVAARGIKNPLFAGYQKLQRTAAKYRALKVSGTIGDSRLC